jgi:hypothetical protein
MYFNYTFGDLRIYDNYQNAQKLIPGKNWLSRYPSSSKVSKKFCKWYIFDNFPDTINYARLLYIYPDDTFKTFYSRSKFLSSKAADVTIKNIILLPEPLALTKHDTIYKTIVNGISIMHFIYNNVAGRTSKSNLYFDLKTLAKYFQNKPLSSVSVGDCFRSFRPANEPPLGVDLTQSMISYIVDIIFVCFKNPA